VHTTNLALSLSIIVIQASALPDLAHTIALTEKVLNCWPEDRHKCETAIHKQHKEIHTEE